MRRGRKVVGQYDPEADAWSESKSFSLPEEYTDIHLFVNGGLVYNQHSIYVLGGHH